MVQPGRRQVKGRKFINCEIIGPGNIVVSIRSVENLPYPQFVKNTFYDVDCIQIQDGIISNNATYFVDCDFDGCDFYHVNLLFFRRAISNWHWITPLVAETPLLEDQSDVKGE